MIKRREKNKTVPIRIQVFRSLNCILKHFSNTLEKPTNKIPFRRTLSFPLRRKTKTSTPKKKKNSPAAYWKIHCK
ncbi:hypothetical protein LEP1GSC194_4356 [Leptospira alstonii serovar Sichuan str. 79601]|uniref:Uncharacterized protein n=1 Tax=Leptospira alstonii serovar Sichuan str. 79601 TaxID=1218565 RepID=M6D241_9LEPT|nr:hypothetical protein LEP1GSC194_4356 [Leptospira alstonii serovar Sichuan str. 79601]